MFPMSCFLPGCFFRATFFFLRVVAFDFGFGFGLLIPGMLCMSCWATTVLVDVSIRQLAITAIDAEIRRKIRILDDLCIIPLELLTDPNKMKDDETCAQKAHEGVTAQWRINVKGN